MNKPDSLRRALCDSVPELVRNPEHLHIFIDDGRIIATGAPSLSFEYAYTLKLIVTDFASHPDTIFVPLLAWLSHNQVDLLQNWSNVPDGVVFEADILNETTIDLEIRLKLTESVGVQDAGGVRTITHHDEPPLDPYQDIERWELYIKGEPVESWQHGR